MIPHSLQIKNFLSYGPEFQTIDFRPYHLMYLSGKNGHGKSALLDAMTWAVWGHARKTTNAVKPDQGLLRLGASQMVVLFDFELAGQLYRIKREFVQTNAKQFAYLEFGMIKEDGSIASLTDKTIRATQLVIERTIRLDYESFVNSAFLRQGYANEFSKKSPKDRKEILSTILGLHQFEHLKKRALERVKEATSQRHTISAVSRTLAEQVPKKEELEERIKKVREQVAAIQQDEKRVHEQKKLLDNEQVQLAAQQKEYELARFKFEQKEIVYGQHLKTMRNLWGQWRQVHAKQLGAVDYKQLEAQKKICMQKIQALQQCFQKRLQLQNQLLQSKQDLQKKEQLLEVHYAQDIQKLQIVAERYAFEKEGIEKEINALQKAITELEGKLAVYHKGQEGLQKEGVEKKFLEATVAQFEKRKNAYQQFIAHANWLKAEQESLAQKKEIAHSDKPSCPLCEQNLTAARRKFLSNRFAKQKQRIDHQLHRMQRVITQLKQVLLEQHQWIENKKQRVAQKEAAQKELIALTTQMKEVHEKITAHQKLLVSMSAKCNEQQRLIKEKRAMQIALLADDAECKEKRAFLVAIEKELLSVVYDEMEHKKIEQEQDTIEKKLIESMDLNHEILNQAKRAEEIQALILSLKQQKKELGTVKKLQLDADALAKKKSMLIQNEKEHAAQSTTLQERKEKVREEHGRVKTQQEQIVRIETECKKHQESIEKLNSEIEEYQLIATAAGKDGVQALLIEEAIPEIEQEANCLLAKLTNNQAHVLIESLRDLKSGGSKETLDINISDSSGIRPYELFSGGEAFRIDFALRIAISKLLARRAGTSLQTLIIDEGFGSQDEEGLSLIMDAIYKVQDDFEKVIVVSHLPSMRDQFPVHLIVEKGPNGSQVSIMEQG